MMEFIDESQRAMKDEDFILAYDGDLEEKRSFIAQGREEGLEQGREEGRDEGILDVAKNLIKLNLPFETIKKATNLSEKKIKSLMS